MKPVHCDNEHWPERVGDGGVGMTPPGDEIEAIADQVRAALIGGHLETLEPLLAEDARWGSCVGNTQVVEWMQGALNDGVEVEVSDVSASRDRVILELQVRRPASEAPEAEARPLYQVLFVRAGKVIELQGAASRDEALAAEPSPMPSGPSGPPAGVNKMAAILPTHDLAAALEHYRRLGFAVSPYEGGGYGSADRGSVSLHFNSFSSLDPRTTTSAVYLYVDDADELYAEWRASGVTGQFFEPEDTEYGLREGAHIDRDGNLIRFGSPLRQADRPEEPKVWTIGADEPLAVEVVDAIHAGDPARLKRLLLERPGLADARLGTDDPNGMTRSLLHVATDWPGQFPNVGATIVALVAAGADVDARFTGPHAETPLHWAASSDDVEALDALIDAGADTEAPGAVIAGGTPLTDAVAFGQWRAARRLVERGAHTPLREAAALGLMDRVQAYCVDEPRPTSDDLTQALWYAGHGGQQMIAEYLLERGAELNWISSWDELTPLDAARRSGADDLVEWLRSRGAKSTAELG